MPFRGFTIPEHATTIEIHRFDGAHRLPPYATPAWRATHATDIRKGLVVDTETTGLDPKVDKLIEIALLPFSFDRNTGDMVDVREPFEGFQDPGTSLPPAVVALTGITDDMVRGQRVDVAAARELMAESSVVIAHNASFDRPFVEQLLGPPGTKEPMWGCSLQQVDWPSKGMPANGLEVLSVFHGFFTDNHRARPDADAVLHLMGMCDEATGHTYLHELLTNMRKKTGWIRAVGAPYDTKDTLRQRRYRWDAERKVWQREIARDDLAAENDWLSREVYGGTCRAEFDEVRWQDRFKS